MVSKLFKGCHAHLSYLNTESWCLVYAYIILKVTDPKIKFGLLQEHHDGGGSTSSLYPDLPLTFMQKKTFLLYPDSNYFCLFHKPVSYFKWIPFRQNVL